MEIGTQADLEEKYGTLLLPKKVQELLMDMAYERGHSAGWEEVAAHYQSLSKLALLADSQALEEGYSGNG